MDADALYGLPLEEFTRARDALARALREAGDREEATRVASLRKPMLAAWAVNQLARRHARAVDLLLDASHRLIEAQTTATPHEDVAAAAARQRHATAELALLAEEVLGERATPATARRVAETLRSASLTEDGRAALARGILDREVSTTGWEIVEAAAPGGLRPASRPSETPRRSGRAAPAKQRAAERRARLAEARATVAAARSRAKEASGRLREAERTVGRLEEELDTARRDLDEARGEARAADRALAEAEAALTRARGTRPS